VNVRVSLLLVAGLFLSACGCASTLVSSSPKLSIVTDAGTKGDLCLLWRGERSWPEQIEVVTTSVVTVVDLWFDLVNTSAKTVFFSPPDKLPILQSGVREIESLCNNGHGWFLGRGWSAWSELIALAPIPRSVMRDKRFGMNWGYWGYPLHQRVEVPALAEEASQLELWVHGYMWVQQNGRWYTARFEKCVRIKRKTNKLSETDKKSD
jgi:hypothetical protein